MRFHIASESEILEGKTTDVYFLRTKEILEKNGVERKVYAEFTVMNPPYDWVVFAGLDEVIELLRGKAVNLYAIPEGTIFPRRDETGYPIPVIAIEGDYKEFAIYETPILGFICQASGIATKAARVRLAAGEYPVLSFGVRRMHPAIAPLIDRASYIGGCDGVSSIVGAEHIGKKPKGTMPHALILTLGEEEAWKKFDEFVEEGVPRIALIDTFGDEKFESLKAAEILKDLAAVRLDTPSSRRGNFEDIIREVRWELDIRGYKNVGIFVSGGLNEETVRRYREAGATGFGVGTSLSNAKTIDYAMDIVEIEGKPMAKKGKFSGAKKVYRCKNCGRFFVKYKEDTMHHCPACGGKVENIMRPYLINGEPVEEYPDVDDIRNYVLEQLKRYHMEEKL
ncbi:nicotinate phosphoribosyltransferase [Euryarchaeota archaeon ex4484_178]|nr:MAG: nicotinate phosphoribosyltransferase [Euryarchaeota archaeon ex4484_178]